MHAYICTNFGVDISSRFSIFRLYRGETDTHTHTHTHTDATVILHSECTDCAIVATVSLCYAHCSLNAARALPTSVATDGVNNKRLVVAEGQCGAPSLSQPLCC